MRLLLVSLLCLAVPAWAAPKKPKTAPVVAPAPEAPAPVVEDKDEKARTAKARGDAAMDSGRPAEALMAYEESYALSPTAALLYNRARAYEKLQQFPQALELLTKFSVEADVALKSKVPKLNELLATYKNKTTRLFIQLDGTGVEVRLGERILGKSPLPQPMVVNAGPPEELSIVSETYFPLSQQLALPGGGDVHVQVPLASKSSKSVLRVSSKEVGAMAVVDDGESGNVPLDAVVEPGTHQVRLTKDGFLPALTTVLVQAGELRLVELGLQPEARIYERWYFWAAIGAVVAAGVATGIAWSIEKPAPRGTLNTGEPPITPAFHF